MAREEYDGYVMSCCESAPRTIISAPIGALSFLYSLYCTIHCERENVRINVLNIENTYQIPCIHIFIYVVYLMHGDEMVVISIIYYYCCYCYYHRLAFCGVHLYVVVVVVVFGFHVAHW